MRKEFLNKNVVLGVTLLSVGFLMQACGSGSGGSSPAAGSSSSTTAATSVAANPTLYQACTTFGEAAYLGIQNANYDPRNNALCQLEYIVQLNEGINGVASLESGAYAASTPVQVVPYDTVTMNLTAEYNAQTGGVFSGISTGFQCSIGSHMVSDTNVGGFVYGMSSVFANGVATQIPSNIQGALNIGLTDRAASAGCMSVSGTVTITRCVDSNGNIQPC